ncbi:iron-containing alcohol dehydrogenase [Verrucomicrobiales bacterium]|nr:iron-containing alcohol dehydrogenase [Verrucomicrobiales bacterium]
MTNADVYDVCKDLDFSKDIINFVHLNSTKVIFGPNCVRFVGNKAKEFNATKALIVTDSGILNAGHLDVVLESMNDSQVDCIVYSEVTENPSSYDVNNCATFAKSHSVDLILGLGGGSSLDTAKGANFIITNGGEMKDYRGIDKASNDMLPFFAIPTTAGTGSECQSFAIISDTETHEKMACGDKRAAARIAFLDPLLTTTQPFKITAQTGIDAISHSIESLVTKTKTDVSEKYSRLSFHLINRSFENVIKDPENINARSDMLLGAAYAGTAIECSMLGAAHAAANPMTAKFSIPHGVAVGIMLPHIIKYNSLDNEVADVYDSLIGQCLSERVVELLNIAKIKVRLGEYGITNNDLLSLSEAAATQWTGNFNPRRVSVDDFLELYKSAL